MSKIAKALERAKKSREALVKKDRPLKDQSPAEPPIAKAVERARKSREALVKKDRPLQAQSPAEVQPREPSHKQARVASLDYRQIEELRLSKLFTEPTAIDSYNLLCTQVLNKTHAGGQNTIMVTSCNANEGKTVTTINLAISIARRVQHTVLAVDADLRAPSIEDYLGLSVQKGLSEYLEKEEPISELLVNPGLSKMMVLPAGKCLRGSTEMLGSPKMENLVREMKTADPDRYVIFDSPPLLSCPDALVLASYIDGIILVVEASKTQREQIQEAMELLNHRPILGLVMNKFSSTQNRSYGGYYGNYGNYQYKHGK